MSFPLLVLIHALAQQPPAPQADQEDALHRAAVELFWENDALAQILVGNSDRNYTQGTRVLHLWGLPNDRFGWLDWGHKGKDHRIDLGVVFPAQIMYTPDRITYDQLDQIQGQHPYAGYLYTGAVLRSVSWPWRATLELDVGTTGPTSLAQEVQTWFHLRVCHCAAQPTWIDQIGDEMQVQFLGAVERGLSPIPSFWDTSEIGQVSVLGELRLGTLFDAIGAGAEIKLGRLGPYLDVTNISSAPRPGQHWAGWPFAWFLYLRTEPRSVLRNGTLQGRLFSADPYTVGATPVVWDNEVGAVVRLGDWVAIRLSYVARSTEIQGRRWDWNDHVYGVFHLVVGRLDSAALQ